MSELRKRITLVVASRHAMTVIGALVDKNVIEFHMEDIADENGDATKPKKHYVPGATVLSTLGAQFTPGMTFNHDEAVSVTTDAGYADTSAAGALSALVNAGYVERLGKGKYKALKAWPDKLPARK